MPTPSRCPCASRRSPRSSWGFIPSRCRTRPPRPRACRSACITRSGSTPCSCSGTGRSSSLCSARSCCAFRCSSTTRSRTSFSTSFTRPSPRSSRRSGRCPKSVSCCCCRSRCVAMGSRPSCWEGCWRGRSATWRSPTAMSPPGCGSCTRASSCTACATTSSSLPVRSTPISGRASGSAPPLRASSTSSRTASAISSARSCRGAW